MSHYDEQLLENIYTGEDGVVTRKTKIHKTNAENHRVYEEALSNTREECYGRAAD